MASCTFNPGIADSNPYAVLTVNETSYDINNNSSVVSWELAIQRPYNVQSTAPKDYTVVLDGATVASGITYLGGTGKKVIASGTKTIYHDSEGYKTISFSFTLDFDFTWSGKWIGLASASGSLKLTDLPKASSFKVSSTSANMGAAVTFTITRAVSSLTHKLTLTWGGKTTTIATGVGTSYEWTIPLSLANDLPSSTSSGCVITCITYNGSVELGKATLSMTLKVPSSVKPTISSVTLSEATSGIASKFGAYIQNKSKLKVVIAASGSYSSTIKSYSTKILDKTYAGSTITSGVLTSSGSVSVAVTVTDSRGRTATSVANITVTAYSDPTITAFTVQRCDADGTLNDDGEYVKITASFNISSLSNKNNRSYTIAYKLKEDSDFTTLTSGAVYSLNTTYIPTVTFSGDNAYDFIITVTDYFKPVSHIDEIPTAFTLEDFHNSGTGIAFGKVAAKANTFENALEFNQIANSYAFQPSAFNGEKGYTLLAVIKLNALNVNAPIVFVINRRGALCPMSVYVRFASSSTSTDPDLGSITYEGDNYGAFLVKTATSTWSLYVDNTSGWSNPCLQKWYTTNNQMSRISVSFPQEQVETLPTPYYRATPAVMRSILDCFLPVGTIIHRYDHADPNTMYPGTTWVRIENRFLWGCDEDGIIGLTSGEKNHTLTVDELPSHSHGSVYSQHASGTKDKAWYNTSGSSVAYGAVATGGGKAHNNMPPYIHVSVWRRTA